MNQSGNNWSKLAYKFAFALNTSVNYTTGRTPHEIGLLRDKDKQCKSEFCDRLQAHTHSKYSLPNNSLNHLLRPQLSDELLKRENDFKRIYSSTYQKCRQNTSKEHEHRNRFKLGRPIRTVLGKPRVRPQEVSETETTTSKTVYSNKTNHKYDVRNTRRCKSRQRQNYAQKSPHRKLPEKRTTLSAYY